MKNLCSVYGTLRIPKISICWDCVKDWGSVYSFTRKTLSLAALILISTAVAPVFSPAQLSNERLQQKVEDMNVQLIALANVPQDLATLKVEMLNAKYEIKEMSERMTYVMLAIFGAIAVKFLEVFGVGLKKQGGKIEPES